MSNNFFTPTPIEKPVHIPGKRMVVTKQMILNAQSQTKSNRAAAIWLGVSYTTYKKWAKHYGLFEKHLNQKGVGVKKGWAVTRGISPLEKMKRLMSKIDSRYENDELIKDLRLWVETWDDEIFYQVLKYGYMYMARKKTDKTLGNNDQVGDDIKKVIEARDKYKDDLTSDELAEIEKELDKHIHHQVSVSKGFAEMCDLDTISSPENLEAIPGGENMSIGDKIIWEAVNKKVKNNIEKIKEIVKRKKEENIVYIEKETGQVCLPFLCKDKK
tara:strand:- start:563 stop:1375 length:813 start_codon:yes stop_codon:yes gene_type:complete